MRDSVKRWKASTDALEVAGHHPHGIDASRYDVDRGGIRKVRERFHAQPIRAGGKSVENESANAVGGDGSVRSQRGVPGHARQNLIVRKRPTSVGKDADDSAESGTQRRSCG